MSNPVRTITNRMATLILVKEFNDRHWFRADQILRIVERGNSGKVRIYMLNGDYIESTETAEAIIDRMVEASNQPEDG